MLVTLLFLFVSTYVVTLELEQLPLLAWMTNYLMTKMLTTSPYTYRPEERMQKQRMVYISSPAVRITYTKMAPPVFAPTVLDKTPRERTCPRREARGSEGPTRGRRQPGGREEGRHASRAVHRELHHHRRPLQEHRHIHHPE